MQKDSISGKIKAKMEGIIFYRSTTLVLIILTGLNTVLGDSEMNSTIHIILPENTNLIYFGVRYTDIYLQPDGILTFDPKAKYNFHRNYSDPLPSWVASDDYPLMAPLLFDKGNNRSTSMRFKIYQSSNKSSQACLDHLNDVISKSFVGVQSASLTFALSVTWLTEDLSCMDGSFCQNTNSSLVLATDGQMTFAMVSLEFSDIFLNSKYQSGFNFGYGRGWFDLGLSQGRISGRHLYLIHKERPVRGGCDLNRKSDKGKAFISPNVIDMFGGNILEVSGPCFYDSDNITLLFGDPSQPYAKGECYRVSEIKAKCEVPPLTARGRIAVVVSLNDGKSMSYRGSITVVHPTLASRFVKLEGSGWGGTVAGKLSVRWNASQLSTFTDARADIILVGYSEKTFWGFDLPLAINVPVSQGFASFDATAVSCDAECANFEAGFVAVKVRNITQANNYRTMPSGAMPFGWLMRKHLEQVYGPQWLHEKCVNWYAEEVRDMLWIEALKPCPCSLQQALLDFGRWQTDLSCNMFSRKPTCAFHKGAVHCVRSVGTIQKSGNQCCYGSNGLLRYSQDTFQGSTPDRFHDWGEAPYGTPGSVPSLSHGLADVMTFFCCCIWVDYKDCDFYMDVRPTKDCKYYEPPQQAIILGQSHIKTFDGHSGTVCMEGDYILYQDSEMMVHGRFQRNTLSKTSKKSVILTAVGVKVKDETVIIQLKHSALQQKTKDVPVAAVLDVIVNGEFQFYDREDNKWQDFKRLTVLNNDDLSLKQHSNFTILSKQGVGILASEFRGSLQLTVTSLPEQTKTSGGLLSSSNKADHQISWLSKWYVNDSLKQIIPYSVQRTILETQCPNVPENFTSEICSGDKMCLYDLLSTEDFLIATNTLISSQRHLSSKAVFSKVNSCGLLNVPRSTKSSFNYTLGSSVSITGCRVGTLHGQAKYTCTESGNSQEWSPRITAVCSQDSTGEVTNIASIIAGVIVCVSVILIIIIVFIIWQRRKRNDGYSFYVK